jgi:hypothetical protein
MTLPGSHDTLRPAQSELHDDRHGGDHQNDVGDEKVGGPLMMKPRPCVAATSSAATNVAQPVPSPMLNGEKTRRSGARSWRSSTDGRIRGYLLALGELPTLVPVPCKPSDAADEDALRPSAVLLDGLFSLQQAKTCRTDRDRKRRRHAPVSRSAETPAHCVGLHSPGDDPIGNFK